MFGIIGELLEAFEIAETTFKDILQAKRIIKAFKGNKTLQRLIKVHELASKATNPEKFILDYINRLQPKQLQAVQKGINKVLNQRHLKRLIHLNRKKGKSSDQENNFFSETEELPKEEIIINSSLSSSWLQFGHYTEQSRNDLDMILGTLKLTIKGYTLKSGVYKPPKSYDYFDVPYSVWRLMTKAMGSYGTGAGSVFWSSYLRIFYGTSFRKSGKTSKRR